MNEKILKKAFSSGNLILFSIKHKNGRFLIVASPHFSGILTFIFL